LAQVPSLARGPLDRRDLPGIGYATYENDRCTRLPGRIRRRPRAVAQDKIVVLEKDQGEKRVRRPRVGMQNPTSEFILKLTPENSGSEHLVLSTETIPPGGVIPRHKHLGQDEILFFQTGQARVTLNDKSYDVHAGGMVFFPMNTWVTMTNTGTEPIQLIFIFSAPGFEQHMRCSSVPEGKPAPMISLDDVRACAYQGHVEYEALQQPKK
jgi:mannose-6-phosphate isomerase-like protein (cupin superfamily)